VPSITPWGLIERPDGEFWAAWILASRNATLRARVTLSKQK
jgi:hypothetical protein